MDRKAFVTDGFVLPEAKSSPAWLDADTLLLSSALGDGMATTSGYARTLRQWRRGQPMTEAPVIFEIPADHMGLWCDVDHTAGAPRIWFVDRLDFFKMNLWLGDATGAKQQLDLPTDAWVNAHGDWVAVKPRSAWTVGGEDLRA